MKVFAFAALILMLGTRAAAVDLAQTFHAAEFQLGPKKLHLWIADDEAKRERGLMFVKKLKSDEGMLFVFDDTRILSFWMKNTLIPLSIGFFDKNGKLFQVIEMPVPSRLERRPPVYPSRRPALFALEMAKGWFKKNKIHAGAVLKVLSTKSDSALKHPSFRHLSRRKS